MLLNHFTEQGLYFKERDHQSFYFYFYFFGEREYKLIK